MANGFDEKEVQLIAKYNELLQQQKQIVEDIKESSGEMGNILQKSVQMRERLVQQSKQQISNLQREIDINNKRIGLLEQIVDEHGNITKEAQEQIEERKKYNERLEETIENLSIIKEQQKDITDELIEQQRQMAKNEKVIGGTNNIFQKLTNTSGKATGMMDSFGGSILKTIAPTMKFANTAQGVAVQTGMMSGSLLKASASMGPWGIAIGAVVSALGALVELVIGTALAMDEQRSAMNKVLGTTNQMDAVFQNLAVTQAEFGVGAEKSKEITQTLALEMRQFRFENEATQIALAQNTAQMDVFGISANTSAQFLQETTKALQQTSLEAMRTEKDIVSFALEARLAPERVVQSFATNIPRLVLYGEQADDVFKEMTLTATNLGMKTEQLFSITEGFATFESAAQTSAKLNSILGGGMINSVELLTASLEDPIEAVKLLREAFSQSGVSFENLNAAQRRMVADILKVDASMAAKLLGNEDEFQQAQESLENARLEEERIKEQRLASISLMNQLSNILKEVAQAFPQGELQEFLVGVKELVDNARSLISIMKELAPIVARVSAGIATLGLSEIAINTANLVKEGGFAKGVDNFGGGMALVGEKGPEMVSLPPASNVITNSNTQRIANALAQTETTNNVENTTNNINNNKAMAKIEVKIGERVIADMVADVLQDNLQLNVPYVG